MQVSVTYDMTRGLLYDTIETYIDYIHQGILSFAS